MNAHATAQQLTAYLPSGVSVSSGEAARLLARASERIDYWTKTPYNIDATTGLATYEPYATALANATCALVEQWLEVGEDNDIDGRAATQTGVNGFSGTRAPSTAPRAIMYLVNAGLA